MKAKITQSSSARITCGVSRAENRGMLDKQCPSEQINRQPSNLQTIERHVGQNNDPVPHDETPHQRSTDVGDVEDHDKGEEIVNQASGGETSTLTVNEDDKRSEEEQTGTEDNKADGEHEAAEDSHTHVHYEFRISSF